MLARQDVTRKIPITLDAIRDNPELLHELQLRARLARAEYIGGVTGRFACWLKQRFNARWVAPCRQEIR